MNAEDREPATASHIILMRHAHKDESFQGNDYDRPLTDEGRAAALTAGLAMYGEGHHPGPLLASGALRARQTAQIIAEALHIPVDDIYYSDNLLGATTDTLETEIRKLAVPYTLVTLIGHNPGVSELGRILARDPKVPDFQQAEWRYLPWPPRY